MDTLNTFAPVISAALNGDDLVFTPQEPETKPCFMPPVNVSEAHLPAIFLLDRSLSNSLNGGDEEMQNSAAAIEASLQNNTKAAGCMDIQIITFGSEVRVLQDWVSGTDYHAPSCRRLTARPLCMKRWIWRWRTFSSAVRCTVSSA